MPSRVANRLVVRTSDPDLPESLTLEMAAVWIVTRSAQEVTTNSFAELLGVVGDSDHSGRKNRPHCDPLREFRFALRSGHLDASGITLTSQSRAPISKADWSRPYFDELNELRDTPLYAVNEHNEIYRDVRVRRDEVLGIWIPLIQPSETSSAANAENTLLLKPAFPVGFDWPEWDIEQVMAWVAHRNLKRLRELELPDDPRLERPLWYGRLYQSGFVDAASANNVRTALINAELIGQRREGTISVAWWHDNGLLGATPWDWFPRDKVMRLWPDPADARKRGSLAHSRETRGEREPVKEPPKNRGKREPVQRARIAEVLRKVFPNGPPPPDRELIRKAVEQTGERGFSLSTLYLARKMAWPSSSKAQSD
jgi:hypothetical protein